MNCKKIQDLIITDYLDNELKSGLQAKIKAHIEKCAACCQFEQALRQAAVEPFKHVQKLQPPEYLWHRIKETVTADLPETEPAGVLVKVKDALGFLFQFPKPVFAAALVVTVVLVSTVYTRVIVQKKQVARQQVTGYLNEQADFISSLKDPKITYINDKELDLNAVVEEYLL